VRLDCPKNTRSAFNRDRTDAAWGTAKSQQYPLLLSRLGVSCNSFARLGACPFAMRSFFILGSRRFGPVLRATQPITKVIFFLPVLRPAQPITGAAR
jgi:hypothetical protein